MPVNKTKKHTVSRKIAVKAKEILEFAKQKAKVCADWNELLDALYGVTGKASVLLDEYLRTHRRERRSCRHLLKTRTQVDPAWELYRLHPLTTCRE